MALYIQRTASFRTLGFYTVTLLVALQGSRSAQTIPVSASGDLTNLFAPGVLLEDTNGDGAIDHVNTQIVLGAGASASDVSAGADIATRLGTKRARIFPGRVDRGRSR
jgi:hypothetical protein